MKNTALIVFASLCISIIASAQITKGSVLLGGNVSINTSKTEMETNLSTKSNMLTFNPTVGIAVRENWVAGITAGFTNYKLNPSINSYNRDIDSYSGGFFVRRYLTLGKGFYLYGNGTLAYHRSNDKQSNGNIMSEDRSSTKGVILTLEPGITYAINKRFHLEASLNNLLRVGYSTSETKSTTHINGIITNNQSSSKSFEFGSNLNTYTPISIGFRFVLGK